MNAMVSLAKIRDRLSAANEPLPRDAKGELVQPATTLQQLRHHVATPWFWGTCASRHTADVDLTAIDC